MQTNPKVSESRGSWEARWGRDGDKRGAWVLSNSESLPTISHSLTTLTLFFFSSGGWRLVGMRGISDTWERERGEEEEMFGVWEVWVRWRLCDVWRWSVMEEEEEEECCQLYKCIGKWRENVHAKIDWQTRPRIIQRLAYISYRKVFTPREMKD